MTELQHTQQLLRAERSARKAQQERADMWKQRYFGLKRAVKKYGIDPSTSRLFLDPAWNRKD